MGELSSQSGVWVVACVACWALGCATQKPADDGEASEKAGASAAPTPVETGPAFSELLGTSFSTSDPPPCHGSWDTIPEPPFEGEGYFCGAYPAPDDWGDVSVTLVVQNGEVSVITVQDIVDGADIAKERYEAVTGRYLETCERRAAGGRNMLLDCDGWVVDAAWSANYEQAQYRVHFAKSVELLE